MIRLTSVRKEYENRRVLDIDEAIFQSGMRYAVMGANGSGKSTLLRVIAGILAPDAGTVEIEPGCDIGYLPQHPYAFGFSVKKNVMIAMRQKVPSEQNAIKALESVGMAERADQSAGKLSGGEAQRLAVARVLTVHRKILLLDEPTAAADVSGTDMIEQAVKEYYVRTDCTQIVCTHSPAQALRMSDIVLFMNEGKIVEQGDSQQVLYSPKTPQVSAFLKHWRI